MGLSLLLYSRALTSYDTLGQSLQPEFPQVQMERTHPGICAESSETRHREHWQSVAQSQMAAVTTPSLLLLLLTASIF